jgi:hypothetical protein
MPDGHPPKTREQNGSVVNGQTGPNGKLGVSIVPYAPGMQLSAEK